MAHRSVIRAAFAALVLCSIATPTPAAEAKPKIVLAGDSTVTDHAGWGVGFSKSLNDNVDLINLSLGGRSSKSFRDEGQWQKVLDAKPSVVLIQFGHNDQPGKGPERETDPATTYRANLVRFIDEAKVAGAKPVVLTSIARRRWAPDKRHIVCDLAPYAEAARIVARESGVPLIDLHARSVEVYESLGQAGCDLISPLNKQGEIDTTHLNAVGSEVFGPLVADELRRVLPDVARNIRGYVPPEKRLATTQPTTVPTAPDAKEQLNATAGKSTTQGTKVINVAANGSGDVPTLQAAVAAVPADNSDRTTIRLKPGIYTGPVVVPRNKINVTFEGDSADNTVITFALNVTDPIPAGVPEKQGGNGVIVTGDGFQARNLTFRNTSGDHGQAIALRLQADRIVLENCRLLGWQDTLLVHTGRHYLKNCYIEGRVDFIYGGATAVFDECHLHTKEGGYITAASTPQETPYGYLFYRCKITGTGKPAYLGRPWRPYGAVAFIECDMGPLVEPRGWHNWGKESNEQTARYVEYRNTGPGGDRAQRVKWSRELSPDEASQYTPEAYLRGNDQWNPVRAVKAED